MQKLSLSISSNLTAKELGVHRAGVAPSAVAGLHQVHRARAYADCIVPLRDGRIVEDAAASRLDARTIEQIYERNGERNES